MSNSTSNTPNSEHNKPDDNALEGNKPTSKGQKPITDDTVHTDVSIICGEQSTHKKPSSSESSGPTSKRSYQIMLVLGLMAAFVLAMGYQTLFGHAKRAAGDVIVEEGQSYYGFLPQFQRDVPLFSANLAKLYIRSVNTPLHAGTYEVPENANLVQLMEVFKEGPKVEVVTVQIIEGKTAADLYKALASNDSITLKVLEADGTPKANFKQLLGIDAFTPNGEFSDNLEGWFTPDTYYYNPGVTDKQVLTDLYQHQQEALAEAWENRAEGLPYQTPYEALIMASIIEKETSIPSERELVSAVFVNRLKKGIRLQTDPTIIYGMGKRYNGDIRRQDINEKTAYNTYQIEGLPPTPIALPSHASIKAAMHPAESDALYFVATGTGGHKFTKTLAEHNKAVQAYLSVMRNKKTESESDTTTESQLLQDNPETTQVIN